MSAWVVHTRSFQNLPQIVVQLIWGQPWPLRASKKFYKLNQGAPLRESQQHDGGRLWSLLLGLATWLLVQTENTERAPSKILENSRWWQESIKWNPYGPRTLCVYAGTHPWRWSGGHSLLNQAVDLCFRNWHLFSSYRKKSPFGVVFATSPDSLEELASGEHYCPFKWLALPWKRPHFVKTHKRRSWKAGCRHVGVFFISCPQQEYCANLWSNSSPRR